MKVLLGHAWNGSKKTPSCRGTKTARKMTGVAKKTQEGKSLLKEAGMAPIPNTKIVREFGRTDV